MNIDQLARVRRICLDLPETTEKTAWGMPTFRVRNKMFAMYAENHHGDGRLALWVNAPPDLQELHIAAKPDAIFRPPYMGPKGWIGLLVERLDDTEIQAYVKDAFCMVAPKRLQRFDAET